MLTAGDRSRVTCDMGTGRDLAHPQGYQTLGNVGSRLMSTSPSRSARPAVCLGFRMDSWKQKFCIVFFVYEISIA